MQTYRTVTKIGVLFVLAVVAVTSCAAPLLPGAGTPERVQIVQVEQAAAVVETAPVPGDAPQPAEAPTSDSTTLYTFDDVELAPTDLCSPDDMHYSSLNRDDFWDGKIKTALAPSRGSNTRMRTANGSTSSSVEATQKKAFGESGST